MKPHTPKPLVLCEGKEDKLVIETLAEHAGLTGKLAFDDYGGKDNLRNYLKLLKARPEYVRGEYSKVLVTRDADSDFPSAWDAAKGSIQDVFSIAPGSPGAWVRIDDRPEIAAWIIPGPGQSGMIETLCVESSRSKIPDLLTCLDSFVACLNSNHGKPIHEKARFAIWTIAASGPVIKDRLSMERAIPQLPIDWNDQVFDSLRSILTNLAGSTAG